MNVRTGFLDTENMGKDTKNWLSITNINEVIWYCISCSFGSDGHFLFCVYYRKVAQWCWSGTFLILIHMICKVNDVKYDM